MATEISLPLSMYTQAHGSEHLTIADPAQEGTDGFKSRYPCFDQTITVLLQVAQGLQKTNPWLCAIQEQVHIANLVHIPCPTDTLLPRLPSNRLRPSRPHTFQAPYWRSSWCFLS